MDLPTRSSATRSIPRVGLEVEIVHLGAAIPAVVEEVRDEGRTLIVAGQHFVLSALTAHYVRAGDPYYGVRLRLAGAVQPWRATS